MIAINLNDYELLSVRQSILFKNISDHDFNMIISAPYTVVKEYQAEQMIADAGQLNEYIGFILNGEIRMVSTDYWGRNSILWRASPHTIIGMSTCFNSMHATLSAPIFSVISSKIIFIHSHSLLEDGKRHNYFPQLLVNLLEAAGTNHLMLLERIVHLSRRNTREKLLAFLSDYARNTRSNEFDIPMTRQEIADYLAVERSAMSSELNKLKRENIIDFKNNHFILKSINAL